MINNATVSQLRSLKLQGFADALQQQQEQANCLDLSFDERLALLVDREVHARGDRKRTRLLQRAQLKYPTATLEDASFDGVRGIDRSAEESATTRWWRAVKCLRHCAWSCARRRRFPCICCRG